MALRNFILSGQETACLDHIAYHIDSIQAEYVDLALKNNLPRVASKIMELLMYEENFTTFLQSFFGKDYPDAFLSLLDRGFPFATILFMLFYGVNSCSVCGSNITSSSTELPYNILKHLLESRSLNLNILIKLCSEEDIEFDTDGLADATPLQLLLYLFSSSNENRKEFLDMLKLNPYMQNSDGEDAYYILYNAEYKIAYPEEIRRVLDMNK